MQLKIYVAKSKENSSNKTIALIGNFEMEIISNKMIQNITKETQNNDIFDKFSCIHNRLVLVFIY